MKGLLKFVALVGLILILQFAVIGALIWGVIHQFGLIEVSVHDRGGTRVRLPIPAVVIHGGAGAIRVVARPGFCNMDEAVDVWSPVAEALADDIESSADFTLLELDHDDGRVTIRKDGDRVRIDVRGRDGDVEVSVPSRTVGKLIRSTGGV